MASQATYAPAFGPNDVGQHQHNSHSQQHIHQPQNNMALQHQQQLNTVPHHQQQSAHHHSGAPQEWRASYCGFCSPFELCMKTWCCPCFVYGKTKHRLQMNGDMTGYSSMNSNCFLFCGALCCGLSWIPTWMGRSDMRKKHNLEGNGCTDCLSACCCPLCDMVQQEKEAEFREGGGYEKPVVSQYQAQGGMAYPAPVQKH